MFCKLCLSEGFFPAVFGVLIGHGSRSTPSSDSKNSLYNKLLGYAHLFLAGTFGHMLMMNCISRNILKFWVWKRLDIYCSQGASASASDLLFPPVSQKRSEPPVSDAMARFIPKILICAVL